MKEYPTETVNIKDIKLDGDNPNKMTKDVEMRLGKSMQIFGNTQDIVIDKNTMILADGEHRLQQYIKQGLTDIPAKLVPFKSDAERRAYRQAANKIKGEHDPDLDAIEYLKIIEANEKELLNITTGLSIHEVEKHLRKRDLMQKEEDFQLNEELDKITTPETQTGDVYLLGNHRLMCGDSTKKEDVAILMQEDKADMVFTDPPYGIDIVKTSSSISKSNLTIGFNNKQSGSIGGVGIVPVGVHKKIIGDNKPFNPTHLLEYGKNQIIWGGNYFADKLPTSSCWIIWDKRGDIPSNNFADCEIAWTSFKKPSRIYTHKWSGLLREGNRKDEMKSRCHPTQKPVGLHQTLLEIYSQEDSIIMDLYGGSGTTLIACEKTERRCLMMEIDPMYCDVIVNRWEKFTGNKAKKIN